MLQYVIAGLVLGGIYAVASAGLVVTYLSAGVLNFSFGALAYFMARFYYFLIVQQGWAILPAAALCLLVVGPGLGVVLYVLLFRLLRLSSALIQIVATLGLAVTLPPLAAVLFGHDVILKAPGLAPEPVRVYQFLGVPVTMDQIIVYACVLAIVVIGSLVLRYTDTGLLVRAMVDSPAMTSLSGANPVRISIGVWAASTFLAALTGILSAPILGLTPENYTLLMAAAFAAVVAAKLRNLPTAIGVGLMMGVLGSLIPHYLPRSSTLTSAVIPSIPFAVTAIFLVYHVLRTGRVNEREGVGGALDRAIRPQGSAVSAPGSGADSATALSWRPAAVGFALVLALPFVLQGYWIGLLAAGAAYGVLFLSFTIVIGEGGMVWLCMVTFGGVGALTAAQLVTNHGWPVLLAVLAGGLVACPMGILIGLMTIRLGDIYVALVTLSFGLLMDNLVFSRPMFVNFGIGVDLDRPQFARGDRAFTYLALGVFVLIAVLIVNLRRSTTGLALTAVRSSEPASKTIGVNVVQMKVILAGLAAFIAGVGGALLASSGGLALPSNFATLGGVAWLAVLVTQGVRSNTAALLAGLSFTMFPAVVLEYFPASWAQIPPILFGLGAIAVAKNPDGILAEQARQVRTLWARLRRTTRRANAEPSLSGVPQ